VDVLAGDQPHDVTDLSIDVEFLEAGDRVVTDLLLPGTEAPTEL